MKLIENQIDVQMSKEKCLRFFGEFLLCRADYFETCVNYCIDYFEMDNVEDEQERRRICVEWIVS